MLRQNCHLPREVCFIALKVRQFDVKDVPTDLGDASNPADDGMISVLEDHRNDPVVRELVQFIHAMSQDEQIDLVALAWLGRDDGDIEDWQGLRAEAARTHNDRTASYFLGLPLLYSCPAFSHPISIVDIAALPISTNSFRCSRTASTEFCPEA